MAAMPNVPADVQQMLNAEIAQGLNATDPQNNPQLAVLNGWDEPGVIPGVFQQQPQRPQAPVQEASLTYTGPRPPAPDLAAIQRENAELRQRLAAAETAVAGRNIDQAIEGAVRGVKLPDGWANLTPEQQEQTRTRALLDALKPLLSAKAPAASPNVEDRLDDIDMRTRFRDLSSEQVTALREIKRTRAPQSDQELLALAMVVHPALFQPRQAAATGYVAPPGRGMPDRNAKPGFGDYISAAAGTQGIGTRHVRDRLGAQALRALAEDDPLLFSQGR